MCMLTGWGESKKAEGIEGNVSAFNVSKQQTGLLMSALLYFTTRLNGVYICLALHALASRLGDRVVVRCVPRLDV